jgi:hypothetical protein
MIVPDDPAGFNDVKRTLIVQTFIIFSIRVSTYFCANVDDLIVGERCAPG